MGRAGRYGLLAALLSAAPISAATVTVCPSGCDHTTIQAAVLAASPGDTIDIAAGTYVETVNVAQDLTLVGAGPDLTFVDGNASGSVFTIAGSTVTLRGMTVRNGDAAQGGGVATAFAASLTLVDVHVRDNNASDVGAGIYVPDGSALITTNLITNNSAPGNGTSGGGLFNRGTTTIRDSIVRYNDAYQGGGIYNDGSLQIERSTIHGNSATYGGGLSHGGGALTIADSTISGNNADEGGGMDVGQTNPLDSVSITRTTIAANTANAGGGLFDYSQIGSIAFDTSLVAGNAGGNCDPASSTFQTAGHNVEDADSCDLTAASDRTNSANVQLGPLADNGGPTPTHALGAASDALDAGPANCPPVDQRGEARPVDGDLDSAIRCDAGSFERTCGGAYATDELYGTPLFAPRCSADASGFPGVPGQPHVYEGVTLPFYRGARDRLFVVAAPLADFGPLVVDDELWLNGQDTGLGPNADRPGRPPYDLDVPIQNNRVTQPAHELTTALVPVGANTLNFELRDYDRQIHGNMALYLVVDCGIVLEGNNPTTIRFLSLDASAGGFDPRFEVASGFLGDLRSSGDYGLATCLADGALGEAFDNFEAPPPGQGRYYLARGENVCLAQGFGDASPSLATDPRDALESASPCP